MLGVLGVLVNKEVWPLPECTFRLTRRPLGEPLGNLRGTWRQASLGADGAERCAFLQPQGKEPF